MSYNLSEKELKQLQEINIEMASFFVEFCKKHQLLCYLCGGGCIGTIRHKGMIPWDDDLDFFMPRKDYEKLEVLWKKELLDSDYILEKSDINHVDHNLFITIRNRKTTFIKPYQANLELTHGVPLDILPLDGYPDTKFKRRMQVVWAMIYSLFCAQLIPTNHGKKTAALARLLLGVVPSKKMRYKIWKFAEKQMTKYDIKDCTSITELCSGPGYMKKRYPKDNFESAIFSEFEEGTMPIPVGYDSYLKIAFGNYMELPPKEKQKSHHDALYVDLDNPYTKYKGNYYCK